MDLLAPLLQQEGFSTVTAAIQKKESRAALFGLHPIHRALYAAAVTRATNRVVLLVSETEAEAVTAAADINELGMRATFFPARDFVLIDIQSSSHEQELIRLGVMGRILEGSLDVVCCSLEALLQYTMPCEIYQSLSFQIKKGKEFSLSKGLMKLVAAGYTRCDRVEGAGQFAVRGGILDIYPAHGENPIRIELFGDVVDGLAVFDAQTQRRIKNITTMRIPPAREVVLGESGAQILNALLKKAEGNAPALADIITRDLDLLENGITPPVTDRYLRVVYQKPATLLDYLPEGIVFLSESRALQSRLKNILFQHTEELLSLEQQGLYVKNSGGFFRESIEDVKQSVVFSEVFTRTLEGNLDALLNVRAGVIPRWTGEFQLLADDLRGYTDMGFACVVLAGTQRAAAALSADLSAAGLTTAVMGDTVPASGTVGVGVGSLSAGFELPAQHLCVITGRRDNKPQKKKVRVKKRSDARAIASLEDLKPGDYVVHQNHGIGIFNGIHRIDHHGLVRDYIKISYRGADTLYVPVTQLDMVSQYISPKGDDSVKLAKLHSGDWNKTKQSVYRAVREMAKELIELYAKREKADGIAFSEDTDWQREFEARFAYDETDDQLRAVSEIKTDMQKRAPMDRLLCGDVGVGKTEVALRAIFKCISDGYQCAVLVPTTILAWQHYNTFRERFEAYPIKTAMLSRFATAKEAREAVAGIKNGTVDIVVGTHRLLQKDIRFHKLGLLVVDEEQRFGVAHKEKLKEAFAGVDVLTLSATPIPRTLNMAMSGIRDMSVIEEPPQDRHPVQTYVVEYDEAILTDAIRRELSRGGQVYYLHNRIDSIEGTAYRLSQLFPDATVEVAHGRMDEGALSEVWRRLIAGECDILVCTTLIETGVDVPNVNTLIVEDADRMGLSQLYQIRGRVGRSGRRAFAWFTFRRDKTVSEIAAKRLAAIRDFTSFGSGFKIAMRDLQIRGAGSVLSARQSGHMAAVGYDTYLRILEQAISDETGQLTYKPPIECTVDLSVSAYIPDSYIPDNESRIEMYKRIAAIADDADAADAIEELTDRFGTPPAPVCTLAEISLIRTAASALGIYEVKTGMDGKWVLLYSDAIDEAAVGHYMRLRERRLLYTNKGKPHLMAEIKQGESQTAAAVAAIGGYRDSVAACKQAQNAESHM